MTIASSRQMPLVAVGSWTDAPVLLNTETGQCRQLQIDPNVRTVENGYMAFIGGQKLILKLDDDLVVYEVDLDGADRVVDRWPFTREILSTESSTGSVFFICHIGGLECFTLSDHKRKWIMSLETSGIWGCRLNHDENILAIKCGFLDGSRIAMVDAEGHIMTYLPDSGENDTLRKVRYFDWSPSGNSFCVADQAGVATVFHQTSFPIS